MGFITTIKKTTSIDGDSPIVIARLTRYASAGTIAIIIDYTLLFLFAEIIGLYYLTSVALAYAIAHSIYFVINKKWVFKGTKEKATKAYTLFILSGLASIFLTTFLVGILTEVFGLFYFISRIIVSIIVGLLNFLFNYTVSFRMSSEFVRHTHY